MRVAVTRDLVCDVELVNIFPIFVESSVQFRVCVDAFGNWGVIDVLFEEKQTLCSLLDGSGQEVYLGHTGECKLVTTAAHQVLPTWIGTYS